MSVRNSRDSEDLLSISHPGNPGVRPPLRAMTRVSMVLGLFFSILLELWILSLRIRVYGADAERDKMEALFRRQARRFRQTAEVMGGLLVKVGQFLSSRVDLLPQPYIQELGALQDSVQPAPWPDIQKILEHELGHVSQLFATFDPDPIASASLGQVYRADTWTGQTLAVKIQRPDIDRIVTIDLRALRLVVALTTHLTRFGRTFDLMALFQEFHRTVHEELDYNLEAEHARLIAEEGAGFGWLVVPEVYADLSTRRVLSMAYHPGIKISDVDALTRAGHSRTVLAERIIHLYLHMVMDTGFFHADPHPGNILVDGDGRIVLLDHGMTGRIPQVARRQIRRLFVGVSERRASLIVDSLLALGVVRPDADIRRLRARAGYLLERYYAETLTDVTQLDLDSLFHDLEQLVRDEPIQFPASFAFLGRAISMLMGLAEMLDPSVNLINLFRPYAERFVTEDAGGRIGYLAHRVQDWAGSVVALPPVALRVLRQAEDGELETAIRWSAGTEALNRLGRQVGGLIAALYVTGFSVLGIWLLTLGWTESAYFAFGWAGLQLVWRWYRNRRSR